MAVVIQEMVECESSGVLFTCDPVTNNPSVICITSNYGLGEVSYRLLKLNTFRKMNLKI